MKNNKAIILAAIAACTLSGCGGSSDSGGGSDSSQLTGVFVDSAVSGLGYRTESQSDGVTNSNGEFQFLAGEQITFFIGDAEFPAVAAAGRITPRDIGGGNADMVINIARLLQSLDADGNPDNGIVIPDTAAATAGVIDFSRNQNDFANDAVVMNLVSNSGSTTMSLISAQAANDHLDASLGPADGGASGNETNTPFSLATLNNRFLIPTPESFAAGRSGYRFDAGAEARTADLGDTDGILRYGLFPWSVSSTGVLTLDFDSVNAGVICDYSRTGIIGELIELTVNCSDSNLPGVPQYYLSKPILASSLEGKSFIVDGSSTIDFQEQGVGRIENNTDGSVKSISYRDIAVEALEMLDNGSGSQLVLLTGTVDEGLLMKWDYNQDDRFIRVTFFNNSGGTWTTVGSHSRD